MRKIALTACLMSLLSVLSGQAKACYSAAEFEAEQGVRIHSELMVIGLTCLKMPAGDELYRKYRDFTEKNSRLLAGYEAVLINHYNSESGAGAPEERLHALRTVLANDVSRQAAAMSTPGFCRQFAPRLDTALAMDEPKLRRWAQHTWPQQPLSEPVCD